MATAGDARRLIADLDLDGHVDEVVAAAPPLPRGAAGLLAAAGCPTTQPPILMEAS